MDTTHLGSNSFLLFKPHRGESTVDTIGYYPVITHFCGLQWFLNRSGRRCGRASRASRSRISARHWSGSLRIWLDATRPIRSDGRPKVGSPQTAFGGRRIGTATLELTVWGGLLRSDPKQS